jgi:hypothetical protein
MVWETRAIVLGTDDGNKTATSGALLKHPLHFPSPKSRPVSRLHQSNVPGRGWFGNNFVICEFYPATKRIARQMQSRRGKENAEVISKRFQRIRHPASVG